MVSFCFCFSLPYHFVLCFIISLFLYIPRRDGSLLFIYISLSSVCSHAIVFLVPLYLIFSGSWSYCSPCSAYIVSWTGELSNHSWYQKPPYQHFHLWLLDAWKILINMKPWLWLSSLQLPPASKQMIKFPCKMPSLPLCEKSCLLVPSSLRYTMLPFWKKRSIQRFSTRLPRLIRPSRNRIHRPPHAKALPLAPHVHVLWFVVHVVCQDTLLPGVTEDQPTHTAFLSHLWPLLLTRNEVAITYGL